MAQGREASALAAVRVVTVDLDTAARRFREAKEHLDGDLGGSSLAHEPLRMRASELASKILVAVGWLEEARAATVEAWRKEEAQTGTQLLLQIPGTGSEEPASRHLISVAKRFYVFVRASGRPLRRSVRTRNRAPRWSGNGRSIVPVPPAATPSSSCETTRRASALCCRTDVENVEDDTSSRGGVRGLGAVRLRRPVGAHGCSSGKTWATRPTETSRKRNGRP